MALPVPRALEMAAADARFELRDRLLQRGAQGVINGLREDVRSRGHEVGRDPEGRAGFEPALHEHAGLVDAQPRAQQFELLFEERGEGGRGLMVTELKDEFHDGIEFQRRVRICIIHILASILRFNGIRGSHHGVA